MKRIKAIKEEREEVDNVDNFKYDETYKDIKVKFDNNTMFNKTSKIYSKEEINSLRLNINGKLNEIEVVNDEQQIIQPNISYWNSNEYIKIVKTIKYFSKLVISGVVGIGSALAMMPIVNYNIKQLENFDIKVHEKEAFFITSTLNTLVLLTICNSLSTYSYITNKIAINKEPNIQLDHNKYEITNQTLYNVGKIASVIVTLQPLFLLWDVEINNKELANDYVNFDEFTAWATFTSIPLVAYSILENYKNYSKTIESYKTRDIEIDSFGAKAFINSTATLSLVGRGIALTALYNKLLQQIGVDEDVSLGLSIAFGGVVTNVAQSTLEYGHIQNLFEKQIGHTSCKNKILGLFTTIEGGWFALPLIAQGLNAIEGLNSLLKMFIFLPTFISKMVYEMHNFYDTFQPVETPYSIQQFDIIKDNNEQLLNGSDSLIIKEEFNV